jgi:hypothetical protein
MSHKKKKEKQKGYQKWVQKWDAGMCVLGI